MNAAVHLNVVVVADVHEPAVIDMVTLAVLKRVTAVASRGTTVQYDESYTAHFFNE